MSCRALSKMSFLFVVGAFVCGGLRAEASAREGKPNVVYMMLDEIGYFELSSMGHRILKTPNIDRLASEGMRFTQCLAGGPVCAPTRSVLLTGKHLGHTQIRGNRNKGPHISIALTQDEFTLGEMFKSAGYVTGGFGKWGLGDTGTTGAPELHGFDLFYGYYNQGHAHSYYPEYLVRNGKKEMLPGNTGDWASGEQFSAALIHQEAKNFVRSNKDKPFFAYLPYTMPHGLWGMPEDDPSWLMYKDMELGGKPQQRSTDPNMYAAMIHMADRYMGEIMKLLKELGIDDNTIVFFSGDNGGQPYFKDAEHPRGVFEPNLTVFSGRKGQLLEGGLRVPYIVRWPGKIKAGSTTDHLCYFPDVMPTLAELSGAKVPNTIDGISFLPTLLGKGNQKQHDFLYWEYEKQIAVRQGNWKLYRQNPKTGWKLYDLSTDTMEKKDLASEHPGLVQSLIAKAEASHTPAVSGTWIDESQRFTKPKQWTGKKRK